MHAGRQWGFGTSWSSDALVHSPMAPHLAVFGRRTRYRMCARTPPVVRVPVPVYFTMRKLQACGLKVEALKPDGVLPPSLRVCGGLDDTITITYRGRSDWQATTATVCTQLNASLAAPFGIRHSQQIVATPGRRTVNPLSALNSINTDVGYLRTPRPSGGS